MGQVEGSLMPLALICTLLPAINCSLASSVTAKVSICM
jgi:hypothetical protein